MADAMVTGRMSEQKKSQGNAVLHAAGLTASQAINLLYDRLIEDCSPRFLINDAARPCSNQYDAALAFVDSLVVPLATRFDTMTDAEIKVDRLKAKGLLDASS